MKESLSLLPRGLHDDLDELEEPAPQPLHPPVNVGPTLSRRYHSADPWPARPIGVSVVRSQRSFRRSHNLIHDLYEVFDDPLGHRSDDGLIDDLDDVIRQPIALEAHVGLVEDLREPENAPRFRPNLSALRDDLDEPSAVDLHPARFNLVVDLGATVDSDASTAFGGTPCGQRSTDVTLYDDLQECEDTQQQHEGVLHQLRDDLDELAVDELISEVSELVLQRRRDEGRARRERAPPSPDCPQRHHNKRAKKQPSRPGGLAQRSEGRSLSTDPCRPPALGTVPLRTLGTHKTHSSSSHGSDRTTVSGGDNLVKPSAEPLGVVPEREAARADGTSENTTPQRCSQPESSVLPMGVVPYPDMSDGLLEDMPCFQASQEGDAPVLLLPQSVPNDTPITATCQNILQQPPLSQVSRDPPRSSAAKQSPKPRPLLPSISRLSSPHVSDVIVRPLLCPSPCAVPSQPSSDESGNKDVAVQPTTIDTQVRNNVEGSDVAAPSRTIPASPLPKMTTESSGSPSSSVQSIVVHPGAPISENPQTTLKPSQDVSMSGVIPPPPQGVSVMAVPSEVPGASGACPARPAGAPVTRLPTFSDCGRGPVRTGTVLARIDALLSAVAACRRNGQQPEFVLPARCRWTDVQLCQTAGHLVVSEAVPARPEVRVRNEARLNLTITLLRKIRHLVATNTHSTKRDIYYQEVALFGSQRTLDALLDDVTRLLAVPRESAHVRATSKGLLAGDLVLRCGDVLLDCSAAEHGVLVPEDIAAVRVLRSNARFLLVVEKDASFQRILDSGLMRHLPPGVLITGKGFPDVNTRRLLRMLASQLRVPALALLDADPHGLEILFVYKYGSLARATEADQLATPQLEWLGVRPTEVLQLSVPAEALIPLTDADRSKARCLLQRPYVRHQRHWQREIREILASDRKAEIQTLSAIHPTFLTDLYLPTKIAERLSQASVSGAGVSGHGVIRA